MDDTTTSKSKIKTVIYEVYDTVGAYLYGFFWQLISRSLIWGISLKHKAELVRLHHYGKSDCGVEEGEINWKHRAGFIVLQLYWCWGNL